MDKYYTSARTIPRQTARWLILATVFLLQSCYYTAYEADPYQDEVYYGRAAPEYHGAVGVGYDPYPQWAYLGFYGPFGYLGYFDHYHYARGYRYFSYQPYYGTYYPVFAYSHPYYRGGYNRPGIVYGHGRRHQRGNRDHRQPPGHGARPDLANHPRRLREDERLNLPQEGRGKGERAAGALRPRQPRNSTVRERADSAGVNGRRLAHPGQIRTGRIDTTQANTIRANPNALPLQSVSQQNRRDRVGSRHGHEERRSTRHQNSNAALPTAPPTALPSNNSRPQIGLQAPAAVFTPSPSASSGANSLPGGGGSPTPQSVPNAPNAPQASPGRRDRGQGSSSRRQGREARGRSSDTRRSTSRRGSRDGGRQQRRQRQQ